MENKLDTKIFFAVIGLIMTVIAWILISQHNTNQRIDAVERNSSDMRVDIGIIKTDVGWIKSAISNQNNISLK